MSSLAEPAAATGSKVPAQFYTWFWAFVALSTLLLAYYYRRMDGEQFQILKELAIAVVPLGVLTIVVLVVILLGICTATESAAIGALGALYLAVMVKFPRSCGWWSLLGAIIGVGLGLQRGDIATLIVSGSLARRLSARGFR
jgi:TRAP-type C4-dicarboxylate transport system permease large subunit